MNSIALFLMGKKGLGCLETILNSTAVELKFVVYDIDQNVKKDYSDEIVKICKENDLNYFRRNLFDEVLLDTVSYVIAISWRWLIKKNIEKLIVFHDSILPQYRGFNPLVTALINGDKEVGVTAIFANKEFDKGDILSVKKVDILYPININEAIDLITICYQDLLKDIILKIATNTLKAIPQDESQATFSLWRDDKDYFINWELDANTIERTVNALGFPYSGARTRLDNKIIILEGVKVATDVQIENRSPGKTLFLKNNMPSIVCGKGLIIIEKAHYLDNYEVVYFNKFRIRLE